MISVIIPCYNFGHLITETIESVLNQTYRNLEVIVINDGSTDNTAAIVSAIAKKDNRVSCYSFNNGGLGISRNRGLEIAKGEFIQFLDADDLLEKCKFENQLMLFATHSQADVVYGSVRYFKENPFNPQDRLLTYWGKNKEWMQKFSGEGRHFLVDAIKGNFSHLSSTLFRRSIVDKVGLFDNEISPAADYHFLIRCAVANAYFLYNDKPDTYSLVRLHPSNMSKDIRLMFSEELKMRRKLIPLLKGMTEAEIANDYAIKSREIWLSGSWKRIFLTGGKFEYLKKILSYLGLKKLAQRIFYGSKQHSLSGNDYNHLNSPDVES